MTALADPGRPYANLPTALYCRASQDRRRNEKSVEDQEDEGKEWIAAAGAAYFGTYTDNDRSASRFATKVREDYERLLRDIEDGRIKVVWFWELSRSQRQLGVYARLRDTCRDLGVHWVVGGRVYHLDSYADQMALGMLAVTGELEPELLSERVKRGHRGSAGKGKPHAFTRYGYRRVYDERRQLVAEEIVPEQAEVIRESARRVLAGESLYAIVRDFAERGITAPRGGPWLEVAVKRMLLNPAYIGKRVYQGQVIGDGIWPPILSAEMFFGCTTVLTDPARNPGRPGAVRHLLTGLVRCGVCGDGLRVQKNAPSRAYKCHPAAHCSIQKEILEDYLTDVILALLAREDAITLFTRPARTGEALRAREEHATLTARLKGFYVAARKGEISPTALAAIEPGLLKDIADAEKRAVSLTVDPVLRDAARPDIAQLWPDYSTDRKRSIIRALMDVRLMPAGPGNRPFDPSRVKITPKY